MPGGGGWVELRLREVEGAECGLEPPGPIGAAPLLGGHLRELAPNVQLRRLRVGL